MTAPEWLDHLNLALLKAWAAGDLATPLFFDHLLEVCVGDEKCIYPSGGADCENFFRVHGLFLGIGKHTDGYLYVGDKTRLYRYHYTNLTIDLLRSFYKE